MIVEARVAHSAKTFIIWLPLHGIFCQGVLLILQGEGILKDIDQHLVSCQTALAVEQKITKASIADFGQCTRFRAWRLCVVVHAEYSYGTASRPPAFFAVERP